MKISSLPLPIYESIQISDYTSKDGEEFSIFLGLDKNMVAQLKKYSLDTSDTELQKNTGDMKRFGVGSYEDWYKKNRIPFALMQNNTNLLAALIWFGPKTLGKKSIKFTGTEETKTESNWHTLAIRSYPLFRGKGLMKNFVNFTIDFYKKEFPNVLLWAGMDNRNMAVVKLMSNLGFKTQEGVSDLNSNWLIMTE